MRLKKCLFILFWACLILFGQAQGYYNPKITYPNLPKTRILFIFDCSQSMYARWQSDTKINIAQHFLSNILDSLKSVPNIELALRVYGHTKNFPPQDCNDTRLEVPFGSHNIDRIKNKLRTLVPRGTTPIASTLIKSADDFSDYCDNCRNVIILITDGIEECGGDPCEASLELQRKGIILKPFVIGIGKNFHESFDCVGTYFDATEEGQFTNALSIVISQILNETTAQVNLLDASGEPTETNVNMTFYDSKSGKLKYNYIHTLNGRGVPDTLLLDPLLTYDIVIHTLPKVERKNVQLDPGRHNIIPISTPQGFLVVKPLGGSIFPHARLWDVLVKEQNKCEVVNKQMLNQSAKYITGKYDLEVQSLPRLNIENVTISQSHTTTVEIPNPGLLTVTKLTDGMFGSVFVSTEKGKLEWVCDLDNNLKVENIALLPGKYYAVMRSKYATRASYTIEKIFVIEPGRTTAINMEKN